MKTISFYKNKFSKKYDVDLWGRLPSYKTEDKFFNRMFWMFSFQKRFKFRILRFHFRRKREFNFKYSTNIQKNLFRRVYKKIYLWRLHLFMKLRTYYGNYTLRDFRIYIKKSLKRNIDFMSSLLLLLECRLDILLYRLNLVKTPVESKQLINFGLFLINGDVVKNHKKQLYINDVISLKPKKSFYNNLLLKLKKKAVLYNFPRYLEVNHNIMKCILTFYPKLKDLPLPFKKELTLLRKFY